MHEPTETRELRTDSWDDIISVLEDGRLGNHEVPQARRDVIADRLRGQRPSQNAIALSGLPGAGKSHVAEKLAEVYDAEVISMGDAIREHAPDNARGDSEVLARFAANTRDNNPEVIPEWVCDLARETDSELIVVDGVRSVTDYEVLEDYFDEFYLLEITAPFYTRLQRLRERGREGEDEFDAVDLAERDEHEREELGRNELLDTYVPFEIIENDDEKTLRHRLAPLVHDNLSFDVADNEPVLPVVGRSEAVEQFDFVAVRDEQEP